MLLQQLFENVNQVMPATTTNIQNMLTDMEAGDWHTEDEGDFIVAIPSQIGFTFICKNHMDDQYMVSSWYSKEKDMAAHTEFEGDLYSCVQYFNQKYNTQFSVKH